MSEEFMLFFLLAGLKNELVGRASKKKAVEISKVRVEQNE